MTKGERDDLHHESTTLCYEWIKLSGLFSSLSNEQWDELAEQIAGEVDALIERRVDEKFTELEAAKAG